MNTKAKNVKQLYREWDNGDCLSHMPTATCEQLNISKILHKPGDDHDLRNFVCQLRELTQCTDDQAVTALYDCENNLDRAVELLLDKFRYGEENEWQTNIGKRTKTKGRLNVEPTLDASSTAIATKEVENSVNDREHSQPEKRVLGPLSNENKVRKQRKKQFFQCRSVRSNEDIDKNKRVVQKTTKSDMDGRYNKELYCNDIDGWDPYTEYGEWTGGIIEVVNSDVNIAKGLEDCLVLHTDLLVETDNESSRQNEIDKVCGERDSPLSAGDSNDDPSDLFVKTARSKRPPPAFANMLKVDLMFAPDVLPNTKSQLRHVFAGDWAAKVLLSADRANNTSSHATADPTDQANFNTRNSLSNTIKIKTKTGNCGSSTILPDKTRDPPTSETNDNLSTGAPKLKSALLQGAQKSVPNPTISDGNAHPSVVEASYDNYVLDGLTNNVGKMTVNKVVSNSDSYAQGSAVSDCQNAVFISSEGAVASPVPTQKNVSSHGSAHVQTSTATQGQQSAISHAVPHFVGQFAPSPYMFNMPGSSGSTPTLFELDQFQILQQHRMLYDMHLQQQAATTVQSVLPLTETSSTVKHSGQSLPTGLAHVTATNAPIRPDIITSTVGHATQLMQAGHPYFHFPRFVVMNGYPNAYLNQQQTGQDGGNSGNSSSQMSNAAVIHGALPVTQPDSQGQPYSNMKVAHTYNDLLDFKYGDPSKQVGFKNAGQPHQQSYVPFTGQGIATTEAAKQMPPTTLIQTTASGNVASSVGYPTSGNAVHYSQQQQQPHQFYPSVGASPYFTAAAVAAAAVAAASAQQQHQQQHVLGGPGSQPSSGSGGSAGPAHIHPSAGGPSMVYQGAGIHVHHGGQQRSAIPH